MNIEAIECPCRDGELCHPLRISGSVHRRAGGSFFNMLFIRKLIQDAKAGHFTAVYLVLELIAVGITVALLIP